MDSRISKYSFRLITLVAISGTSVAWAQDCDPDDVFHAGESILYHGEIDGFDIRDVDQDGVPEILVAQDTRSNQVRMIHVLGLDQQGQYAQESIQLPSGTGVMRDAFFADINNDQHLDIVVGTIFNVLVYTGNESGTYSGPAMYDADLSGSLNALYAADINSDGAIDVMTTVDQSSNLNIYLNDGAGSLLPPVSHNLQAQNPRVWFDDINGDNHLDLVYQPVFGDGNVWSSIGLGDGTFQGLVLQSVPDIDVTIREIRDIDGDQHPDILADGQSAIGPETYVIRMFGQGGGSFTVAAPYETSSLIQGIVDLDGDGIDDVVLQSDHVSYMRGLAGGDFEPEAPLFSLGANPLGMLFGDLDSDGDQDIVVHHDPMNRSYLQILRNAGNAAFPDPQRVEMAEVTNSLRIADLDADGDLDLVASTNGAFEEEPSVFLNDGDGTFPVSGQISLPGRHSNLDLGDLNGDGIPDIVTANQYSDDFSVHIGVGDGTYAAPVTYGIGEEHIPFIALADLTNDGITDVIAMYTNLDRADIYPGLGNGFLGLPSSLPLPARPYRFAVGDIDLDGDLDMVISHYTDDLVSVHTNDGSGSLSQVGLIQPADQVWSVTLGDLDSDGDSDLILGSKADMLHIYSNDGSGSFVALVDLDMPNTPREAHIADLNHDGHPDIVSGLLHQLSVFYADGFGGFEQAERMFIEGSAKASVIGDLDGNQSLDIAVMSENEDQLTVFQSGCIPCAADLNRDGLLNFFDASAFVVAFLDQDELADFDEDGDVTIADVSAFLSAFNQGCP